MKGCKLRLVARPGNTCRLIRPPAPQRPGAHGSAPGKAACEDDHAVTPPQGRVTDGLKNQTTDDRARLPQARRQKRAGRRVTDHNSSGCKVPGKGNRDKNKEGATFPRKNRTFERTADSQETQGPKERSRSRRSTPGDARQRPAASHTCGLGDGPGPSSTVPAASPCGERDLPPRDNHRFLKTE